jgi:Holliday junction DNA helicase RuvA
VPSDGLHLAQEFADPSQETTFISDHKGDAINALLSLGYKQVQADKAVRAVFKTGMSSEAIIRDALKSMV